MATPRAGSGGSALPRHRGGAAKRLKVLWGCKGGVLGGKALVALELRSGLAVAMATAADGETNEAKLVPALTPQGRARIIRCAARWVPEDVPITLRVDDSTKKKAGYQIEGVGH